MAKLEYYQGLDSKHNSFNAAAPEYYQIDHASQFRDWYDLMTNTINANGNYINFFRGVNEAKYKLYNSAQRYWMQNNLMQLESLAQPLSYLDMLQNMVNRAKDIKLLRQVFEYYEISEEQMDIPLLSILQHYKAPTPLMDRTYDLNIALFFAICDLKRSDRGDEIDDYISIYRLNKNDHQSFLRNNLNYISGNVFPPIKQLGEWLQHNMLIYISDFEIAEFEKANRKIKPLTTYYNLNILAQKGLFVFNPNESMPIEEFSALHSPNPQAKIYCYNINKDLAELIKYRIGKEEINADFLFPNLELYSKRVLDQYLKFVMD